MQVIATYEYDPWGKVTAVRDANGNLVTYPSGSNLIAFMNPLRYRGYYQDNDTGFYYLQSRYYDPELKRFINADSYASTGQGFLGHNMFAYCGNNPVNTSDPTGEFGLGIAFGLALTGIIGAAASAINTAVSGGTLADVLVSAGIGAATSVATAVVTATGGLGMAAVAGAAIGLISESTSQVISYEMHKNDEGYEFNWLNAGVSLAHATLFGAFSGVVNNGISKIFSSKADFAAGVFVSSVSSVGASCVDFADRQIITTTTSDYQKKDRIQQQKQTTSQRASRWQRRYAAGHGPVPVLVGG